MQSSSSFLVCVVPDVILEKFLVGRGRCYVLAFPTRTLFGGIRFTNSCYTDNLRQITIAHNTLVRVAGVPRLLALAMTTPDSASLRAVAFVHAIKDVELDAFRELDSRTLQCEHLRKVTSCWF